MTSAKDKHSTEYKSLQTTNRQKILCYAPRPWRSQARMQSRRKEGELCSRLTVGVAVSHHWSQTNLLSLITLMELSRKWYTLAINSRRKFLDRHLKEMDSIRTLHPSPLYTPVDSIRTLHTPPLYTPVDSIRTLHPPPLYTLHITCCTHSRLEEVLD